MDRRMSVPSSPEPECIREPAPAPGPAPAPAPAPTPTPAPAPAPAPAPTHPPPASSNPTRWLGERGRVAYRDALNQLRETLPDAQLLFPDLSLAPEPFARQVAGINRTTRLLLKCRGCSAEFAATRPNLATLRVTCSCIVPHAQRARERYVLLAERLIGKWPQCVLAESESAFVARAIALGGVPATTQSCCTFCLALTERNTGTQGWRESASPACSCSKKLSSDEKLLTRVVQERPEAAEHVGRVLEQVDLLCTTDATVAWQLAPLRQMLARAAPEQARAIGVKRLKTD